MNYKIVKIPKGNNDFREIYIPSAREKRRLRKLLPFLEKILEKIDGKNVNFAFEKGKNCALNAFQHIGYQYTISFDLKDFFDSVSPTHVADLMPSWLINDCFIKGAPRQGLPTSPLVATIAFLQYDALIIEYLRKLSISAIYTRYADDLVFSFDNLKDVGKIKTVVRQVVEKGKFKLNERKTKLQHAKNGHVIVNGIAISNDGLLPSRKTKRKIRAALHQNNLNSAKGLIEWSKCKFPSSIE